MKDDPLPPNDHISRWCGGSHIDPETGSIGPGAFMLKPKDIDGAVSVNWLEFLDPSDREIQLRKVRAVFLSKRMKLGSKAKFAVLNVGEAINNVKEETGAKIQPSILHSPKELPGQWEDPSHSGIYGLPTDDDTSAVALSNSVIEAYPARVPAK